jgi:MFS family permease
VATFGMNFQVVIPPLAQDVLRSDAAGYGFLMTASGVGALTAAIALVVAGRPRPMRIAAGAILLGVGSVALASSTWFPLSLLLMVPIGAGGIAMAATANTTIQLAVPDGLRGRVMSVYTTVFSASGPIGGLLMGVLASTLGIGIAIAIGGALSLLTGIVAFVWYRRLRAGERLERTLAAASTAAGSDAVAVGVVQSTPPNTNAAFNPPNPNEVLSTRR